MMYIISTSNKNIFAIRLFLVTHYAVTLFTNTLCNVQIPRLCRISYGC